MHIDGFPTGDTEDLQVDAVSTMFVVLHRTVEVRLKQCRVGMQATVPGTFLLHPPIPTAWTHDSRVKGHGLIVSRENTKSQLVAEQSLTWRMLESTISPTIEPVALP